MEKKLRVIYAFSTTTEAIKTERLCKEYNMEGRLIPIPPQIKAGCGLALLVDKALEKEMDEFILAKGIKIESRSELIL